MEKKLLNQKNRYIYIYIYAYQNRFSVCVFVCARLCVYVDNTQATCQEVECKAGSIETAGFFLPSLFIWNIIQLLVLSSFKS